MSFVSEIRILKYEMPHVHVIISPTLVTVVEFADDDTRLGDYTPHVDVEKPPATMTLAELEFLANFAMTEAGFKGPRRRLGPVTDGAGTEVEVDTTTPLGPPEEDPGMESVRTGMKDLIAAVAEADDSGELPLGTDMDEFERDVERTRREESAPMPDCEACENKGYSVEADGSGGMRAVVCEYCPRGKTVDLRTVALDPDLAIVAETPVTDEDEPEDELGPAAEPEEMERRQQLAGRVLQHVATPVAERPAEPAPVITVVGTKVFFDGVPATRAQLVSHAEAVVRAAGITLIGSAPSRMNPLNNAPKPKKRGKAAEAALPEPDTKARGKVVIHRLVPITDSAVIAHVGYDPVTCTLEVGLIKTTPKPAKAKAKRGKAAKSKPAPRLKVIRYRFKDVPKEIFSGILTAESAGLYFNTMVKPHYIARRVP